MTEGLTINDFFTNFSHNSLYIRLAASLFLLIAFLICHRLLSRLMVRLVSRIEIKSTRIDSSRPRTRKGSASASARWTEKITLLFFEAASPLSLAAA